MTQFLEFYLEDSIIFNNNICIYRSTILQPPSDLDTITLRQDCVDELLNNEELYSSLESVLSRFVDVDTTISLLIQVVNLYSYNWIF